MLIGIDVGTTAVKAALFDANGLVLQSFTERYKTLRPSPGHVEQEPEDWMRLVRKALRRFNTIVPNVKAIGFCSQVNTHVFVDMLGNPLLPAITWADGRAAHEAAVLDSVISEDEKLRWWGAPLPIDASHPLARMAHVKRHHAKVWEKTAHVMAPKDYCLFHLTGALAADPMTSFGLIDASLVYVPRLLSLVDGAESRLLPLKSFTEVAGHVRKGLPYAGTPMVTGAMDAWAGMLGAGVAEEGQALYLSGTSEILGLVSNLKAPTPGVIAFPKCEGIVLHAGPTQSGGASVAWACNLLGKNPQQISALAALANPAHTPLFLPHLEGERAPLWDAASRGSFACISSSTGPAEMARAVMEGVAYSARLVFDSLEASACIRPTVIHLSGGGSASDIWCQIRADVLQRPLNRTASRDAGVIGAAMMAGVGAGLFPTLRWAARQCVQYDQLFTPNASDAEHHNKRFAAYKLLYQQLKPLTSALH